MSRHIACLALITMATAGATACGSAADPSAESTARTEQALASPSQLGLMWMNTSTTDPNSGHLQAWLLSGTNVVGYQDLSAQCTVANNCLGNWQPFDSGETSVGNVIWWSNPGQGLIASWAFDTGGNVTYGPNLSQQCGPAQNNCQNAWRPIGTVVMNLGCGSGQICGPTTGILWHNAGSGQLSIWELRDSGSSQVTQDFALSSTCGAGCSDQWKAILTADFDGNGESDILWYNASTGVLSVWLMRGGNVIGKPNFPRQCSFQNNCEPNWTIVDATDINGDGHVDLTWFNTQTGVLENWLLDGNENVIGTSDFSRGCSNDATCQGAGWVPVGYITFPPAPPR